jgi:hypothetical protein
MADGKNFRDLTEDEKWKVIREQAETIRYGKLVIEKKHNIVWGFDFQGNTKFFQTKQDSKEATQESIKKDKG